MVVIFSLLTSSTAIFESRPCCVRRLPNIFELVDAGMVSLLDALLRKPLDGFILENKTVRALMNVAKFRLMQLFKNAY